MPARKLGVCEICGADAKAWRCEAHRRCDDCGSVAGLCHYCEGLLCCSCHEVRVEQRVAEFDGCCDYTAEVTCPHCGYVPGDSWEISEGGQDCDDCGRAYTMVRDTTVTYCTEKKENT